MAQSSSAYYKYNYHNFYSGTSLDNRYSHFESLFKRERIIRKRALFSRAQLKEMNRIFDEKKYISSTERKAIAKRIGVGEKQLKIWFQNKRNKEKVNEMDKNKNNINNDLFTDDSNAAETA